MTLSCFQLYYTSLLYEFYKIYKSTSGQAYDGQGLVRIACSGRSFKALTPAVAKYEGQTPAGSSSLPPQDSLPPEAGTQASALHTPCGYSEMHSAIVQQTGGTAMSSAIASSVTTPRPVTTEDSAAVTPKPTAETPMITPVAAENAAAVTPKMTDDTPHPAAQDNATVAGDKKSKSRSSRSKKAAGGTADNRNTGAAKATTPKIQDDHTRPFQPAR
ncbi:hypothetical protein HPB51_013473 [Rhipicephalus microplus]|uniref:Uncharacterized protein n=1 Tax=Rhipicephalus microplus TaxID=6941 RepID=A0A9J6DV63_RHIMP|nr:hypothetical protein HPB51_013473 [Rhipicephalus microplus]